MLNKENEWIETISRKGNVLAIIVRNHFHKSGVHFVTPSELSQQLAYMHHPKGTSIQPHRHNPVPREVTYTQEVLFIKKGKLRVDFYNDSQLYLESRILEGGDAILLVAGGHGFKVLEEIEMFEVKQGPYVGEQDKIRFEGITNKSVTELEMV